MINVDVVVETDHGTITVRIESAAELAAGLPHDAAARCLIDRAATAARAAAQWPEAVVPDEWAVVPDE